MTTEHTKTKKSPPTLTPWQVAELVANESGDTRTTHEITLADKAVIRWEGGNG
jgi:hypothetical protein